MVPSDYKGPTGISINLNWTMWWTGDRSKKIMAVRKFQVKHFENRLQGKHFRKQTARETFQKTDLKIMQFKILDDEIERERYHAGQKKQTFFRIKL